MVCMCTACGVCTHLKHNSCNNTQTQLSWARPAAHTPTPQPTCPAQRGSWHGPASRSANLLSMSQAGSAAPGGEPRQAKRSSTSASSAHATHPNPQQQPQRHGCPPAPPIAPGAARHPPHQQRRKASHRRYGTAHATSTTRDGATEQSPTTSASSRPAARGKRVRQADSLLGRALPRAAGWKARGLRRRGLVGSGQRQQAVSQRGSAGDSARPRPGAARVVARRLGGRQGRPTDTDRQVAGVGARREERGSLQQRLSKAGASGPCLTFRSDDPLTKRIS